MSRARKRLPRSGKMKIKTKLIVTYLVLITIPIAILGVRSYYTSKDVVLDLARHNVLEIVKKNNQLIDERLSRIRDSSLGLVVDCDLFRMFRQVDRKDRYAFLEMDREITSIMGLYFAASPDIYSTQLVTSYYTFGDKTRNIVPPERFAQSTLMHDVQEREGHTTWIPTYDYTEMYQLKELQNTKLEHRYLFSVAQSLRLSCVNRGTIDKLPEDDELPVLVVNFTDNLYRRVFEDSVSIKDSSFFVVTRDGRFVAHQDASRLGTKANEPWQADLFRQGSGTAIVNADGQDWIACYDLSSATGWMSVALIPPESLMGDILSSTRSDMLYLSIFLVVLSALFAILFSSRITNPILKLIGAIRKVGDGRFDTKLETGGTYEFDILINKFNDMNGSIKRLIEENYVVKLREKETEIMALNVQLNPHFLYNTLNIINWMAIYGEKERTSRMLVSLSRMLQYTTHNREETTTLREDLNWLQDYVYILANRFEGKFTVEYTINPQLMDFRVPKLILQPFLENAILHGLRSKEKDGTVHIYGWIQEDIVYFSVEDNGCGINRRKLEALRAADSNHVGIRNVDKRIKLLYGDHYGVRIDSEPGKGTRVLIELPMQSDESRKIVHKT